MTSSRSPLTSLPCVTRLFSVLDVIFVFAFLQNVSAFSKRGKTTVLPVCIHSNLREFVSVGVAATHAVGLLLFNDCLRLRAQEMRRQMLIFVTDSALDRSLNLAVIVLVIARSCLCLMLAFVRSPSANVASIDR